MIALHADQADSAQVKELVLRTHRLFGRLDIIVNNAGTFVTGSVSDPSADIEAFDHQFSINVKGIATIVRAAQQ